MDHIARPRKRPPSHPKAIALAAFIVVLSWGLTLLLIFLTEKEPDIQNVVGVAWWLLMGGGTIGAAVYGRSVRALAIGHALSIAIIALSACLIPLVTPKQSGGMFGFRSDFVAFLVLISCSVTGGLLFAVGAAIATSLHRRFGPRGWRGEVPAAAPIADEDRTCAQCDYPLRGLPLDAHCPECGLPIPVATTYPHRPVGSPHAKPPT